MPFPTVNPAWACNGIQRCDGGIVNADLRNAVILRSMSTDDLSYLTTRELAELLRIKERKVYELATQGEVPCIRVVGKLLFPRADILHWIDAARSGPTTALAPAGPPTLLGSHDPLLDWALGESGCGLAALCGGSRDGLDRLLSHEGVAAGTHIHEHDDGWNAETVRQKCGNQPLVLIEFARRKRGFIVPVGNPQNIRDFPDIARHRVARRHAGAASQQLFEHLSGKVGLDAASLDQCDAAARTEDELGMQVFDEKVDLAFGLYSVANRLRLHFVPLLEERFDLLVWRHAWFEPPMQRLLAFTSSSAFRDKAHELGGYDISALGTVHFNGAG